MKGLSMARRRRTPVEDQFSRRLGRAIYAERTRQKLSRKKLLQDIDVCQAALFRIEMGDVTPSAYHLHVIAGALGVPVGKLV
jgi:transcriptional regulator with XRE-family HTH domain